MSDLKQHVEAYRQRLNSEEFENYDNVYEFVDNELSRQALIDLDQRLYMGCVLTLCAGGPTIWLNTHDKTIYGAWGDEEYHARVFSEACDRIDEVILDKYRSQLKAYDYD